MTAETAFLFSKKYFRFVWVGFLLCCVLFRLFGFNSLQNLAGKERILVCLDNEVKRSDVMDERGWTVRVFDRCGDGDVVAKAHHF